MGPSDAFWRLFASTGGVGSYLLYRVCVETPPEQREMVAAQWALADWEIAEEWDGHEHGAVPERRDRPADPQPGRGR